LTVRARACQPGLPGVVARVRKGVMADKKTERDERLAAALRENLKRRKAKAREVEGGSSEAQSPLHHPPDGPPPRPGED